MMAKDIHIIPYNRSLHDGVMQMESGIIQGRDIQLEIIKDSFISRAAVFRKYYANVAVSGNNELVGTAIGSVVPLAINDQAFEAGFGFDAKVIPGMRKKGIGKMLTRDIYRNFFHPNGIDKCFMTAKLSNAPVLKLVSKVLDKVWLYPFTYLTIPTNIRVNNDPVRGNEQKFSVCLYEGESPGIDYYTELGNGLSYFHTWKLYALRIKKMRWMLKKGIWVLKMINKSRYSNMPMEGDTLSFATLFNHTTGNIRYINRVLEQLEGDKIKYLLVCCTKKDSIYSYLQKWSINTYKYYIVSDFSLGKKDSVLIDVRCL